MNSEQALQARFLKRIFTVHRRLALAIVPLVLIGWGAAMASPLFQQHAIDALNRRDLSLVVGWGTAAALLLLLLRGSEQLQSYLGSLLGIHLDAELKKKYFPALLELPTEVLDRTGGNYCGGRFFHDVEQVNFLCSIDIFLMLGMALRSAAGVFFCFRLDWRIGLAEFAILSLLVLLTLRFRRRQYQMSRKICERFAANRQLMQNSLDRAKLLKVSGRASQTGEKIRFAVNRLTRLRLTRLRHERLLQLLLQLLPLVGFGVALVGGIVLIFRDEWTLGTLWAFNAYFFLALNPARSLCTSWLRAQNALAAMARLEQLFAVLPEPGLTAGVVPEHLSGEIAFNQVTFAYPGAAEHRILDAFNLKIQAGEHVCLTGPSGCGKSTLMVLLLGLYRPESGVIAIDGVPLSGYNLTALRKKIGYLGQSAEFLHGSLRENLSPVATDAELWHALDQVGMATRVGRLAAGLDQMLHESCSHFSGGELMRLALARELLKHTDIYLFDEATAHLDAENERHFLQLVTRELRGKTVVLITHRTDSLPADFKILSLEKFAAAAL